VTHGFVFDSGGSVNVQINQSFDLLTTPLTLPSDYKKTLPRHALP
jgi:hypothetical protein